LDTQKYTHTHTHSNRNIFRHITWKQTNRHKITHIQLDTHTNPTVKIPMKERSSSTDFATYTTRNKLKTGSEIIT